MSAREEFEEWFARELPVHNCDAESGEWHAGVLKAACELTWHSSRDALVVESPSDGQAAANLALILAAPDLLNVLEPFAKLICGVQATGMPIDFPQFRISAEQAAAILAAVDKANGVKPDA